MHENGGRIDHISHKKKWLVLKLFERWLFEKVDTPKLYLTTQPIHEHKSKLRTLVLYEIQQKRP